MPRYIVISNDVEGNPIDGYEIHNGIELGEVMLRADAKPKVIFEALVAKKFMPRAWMQQGFEVEADHEEGLGTISISRAETAWARVIEAPDERDNTFEYLENSDQYLEEGWDADQIAIAENLNEDEYQLIDGLRPRFELREVTSDYPDAKPFWRDATLSDTKSHTVGRKSSVRAVLELRASMASLEARGLLVEAYVDGEYFGDFAIPGDFKRGVQLGLSKSGNPVFANRLTDDTQEIIVALDEFMDRGEAARPFLKVRD